MVAIDLLLQKKAVLKQPILPNAGVEMQRIGILPLLFKPADRKHLDHMATCLNHASLDMSVTMKKQWTHQNFTNLNGRSK
jgi:hypothetical protein